MLIMSIILIMSVWHTKLTGILEGFWVVFNKKFWWFFKKISYNLCNFRIYTKLHVGKNRQIYDELSWFMLYSVLSYLSVKVK